VHKGTFIAADLDHQHSVVAIWSSNPLQLHGGWPRIIDGSSSRLASRHSTHSTKALQAADMAGGKRKASAVSSDERLQACLGGCQEGAALRGGELLGRRISLLGSDQQFSIGNVNDWAARKVCFSCVHESRLIWAALVHADQCRVAGCAASGTHHQLTQHHTSSQP
jgi:hypothetical protein